MKPKISPSAWILVCLILSLLACRSQPPPWGSLGTPQIVAQATNTLSAGPTSQPVVTSTPPPTVAAELAPTGTPTSTNTLEPTPAASPTPTAVPRLRFAVIGDYGLAGPAEAAVAQMVLGWEPDLIITTGDNNYPRGGADTIDENIGQYFHSYIYPYRGSYGAGADTNRFFPSLGNHDFDTSQAQPYLDYFTLPGNERYYSFIWGAVHFFALNSDSREPDGVGRSSSQAAWLQDELASSNAPWKLIYTHYAPHSSGSNGSTDWIQWPFAAWGADAVLAGHDHVYERLVVEGIPYFVNGLGGGGIYNFATIHSGSVKRYNGSHGAMLVEATADWIEFQFFAVPGILIDAIRLAK